MSLLRKLLAGLLALSLALTPAAAQVAQTGGGLPTPGGDVTNTDNACLSVSGTVQTFTAKKLGGGKAGRILAVSINWSDSTLAGTAEITGVTVDGNAMTRAVRAAGDNQNSNSEIWYAQVSSGTTGDVVATFSTAVDGVTIAIYRLVNYTTVTPLATATGTTTATANGLLSGYATLGTASRRTNVSTSLSNMTNDYSTACGSNLWGVHASNFATAPGNLSTTVSPTSSTPLVAMASWSSAGLFQPSQISGLSVWLQGNLITGNNGDSIATWSDTSGNTRDFTEATNRPTLSVASANGRNTVAFSGASQKLAGASLSGFATSGTLVTVMKNDAAVGTNSWVFFGVNASSNHYTFSGPTGDIYSSNMSTTRRNANPSINTATAFNFMVETSAANDSKWYFNGNGTPLVSSGTNTVSFAATPYVGSNGSTFWTGKLAEVILFNSVLSQSNREKIEGYVACKWGLQGNLPGGHPYKTACPAP